jgi:predicted nucleotidyltransferase
MVHPTMSTKFDWSIYQGNLKWLPERTIYMTLAGSHAYGTNIASSDVDWRGIAIAPTEYAHGFAHVFEQAVQKKPHDDMQVFSLQKFMRLASNVNPNVIELLFTDPADHRICTPAMEKLFAIRNQFLSRRAKHTFSGYAVSQLHDIQTHRRWLLNPPAAAPTRAEHGLPESTLIPADQLAVVQSQIKKRLDEWEWHDLEEFDEATRIRIKELFSERLTAITAWAEADTNDKVWTAASRSLGYNENFIELLRRERIYNGKAKEWASFQEWKKNRNPARSELEAKFGYDTKHGMHLVRLLRMCREILTTGKVNVKRPDADELLAIRYGEWSYDKLLEWTQDQDKDLSVVMKTSPLPYSVDLEALNKVCVEIVEDSFR